jgi:hypothetical protein
MNKIKKVKEDAMSDKLIRQYLPNCKILKYNQFKNYKNLDQIIPNNKDYIIILYETSPNSGHWCCLMNCKGNYEYFDSYGKEPSQPLSWNTPTINHMLGQDKPYLNYLIDSSHPDTFYNDIEYQSTKNDINTCGRHCIFRILCMIKKDFNLKQYYKFMKSLKNKSNEQYDTIVSYMINLI